MTEPNEYRRQRKPEGSGWGMAIIAALIVAVFLLVILGDA